MSTDVKNKPINYLASGGSKLPVSFLWQCLFVVAIATASFGLTLWLNNVFVLTFRAQYDHLEGSTLVEFVQRLVQVGKIPQFLELLVRQYAADVYIRDVVHAFGAIGELATILICAFVPKRFLKAGCLSFSVLPPLVFVLLGLAGSFAPHFPYCSEYGYFLVFPSSQAQAAALSCVLLAIRGRVSGIRFTSAGDAILFWVLLGALFISVKYFSIVFGTFARM